MRSLYFLPSLFLLPLSLSGQQITGPQPTAAQCSAAIASLNGGQRDGNWEFIDRCGSAAAAAMAQALRNARMETDSVYLKKLWETASAMRHPDIFSSSLSVFSDKTASVPARVVSVFLLLAQDDNSRWPPLQTSWPAIVSVPVGNSCRTTQITESSYGIDERLPGDFLNQIARATDVVARDQTDVQVIRDWARCIRVLVSTDVPETVAPSLITMTYVCGRQFRVTNASDRTVTVTYRVTKTEVGDLTIAEGSSTDIVMLNTAPVALEYQGQTIATVANAGVACSG